MKYSQNLRIGILGGGQLARFMSLKAQEMGLKVRVLCEQSHDPAAQITKDVVYGSIKDPKVLSEFLKDLSVVTFESEFIDPQLLVGVPNVSPSPKVMTEIRDRLTQKKLLEKFKIPTAPLVSFSNNTDLAQWLRVHKKGLVLKKRLFGYDGYGTVVLKSEKDLLTANVEFSPDTWICEEFCSFKKELAFSIARNKKGEFFELPLVETKQVDSRCDWVKGPIKNLKLPKILKSFKKLLTDSDYVGLLSVELFETPQGLLVNELAPRVHNSAHYSIEALNISQFEAHLRAILNWPFAKAQIYQKGFAMVNLIGSGVETAEFSNPSVGHLHWYGKSQNKPGRKMGHFTVLGSSSEKALKQALTWRKSTKI